MGTQLFIVSAVYFSLRTLNTYCFLFQRTVRKIRMFASDMGKTVQDVELYPEWYFYLYYSSFLRYVFLVWLFFIDYKVAIGFIVLFFLVDMWWPTNDYKVIQIIKNNIMKRSIIDFNNRTGELMTVVLMAEQKTLK